MNETSKEQSINEWESSENEEIESSEELEEIKNQFIAKNNQAHIQIFVNSLERIDTGNLFQEVSVDRKVRENEKQYDLKKEADCIEFIEKYKESEYLVVALILGTFEVVALGDLSDLSAGLVTFLPKNNNGDEMQKCYQMNSYLSLESILSVIGAKHFIKNGKQYVGFKDEENIIISNIWKQFPFIREKIILWLLHVNNTYEINTTLQVNQISKAFERIILYDIADSKVKIFPFLYQNEKNIGVLGLIGYELYFVDDLREEMGDIIKRWITASDSVFLWKAASMTYCYFAEDKKEFPYKKQLENRIVKELINYENGRDRFIIFLLIRSKQFRTLVICALNKIHNMEQEIKIYLRLIRSCYYFVNVRHIELPLVCCDTEQQQRELMPILKDIMTNYSFRKQLYAVLKAYLKELARYNVSIKTLNHISAYFYNMSLAGTAYRDDIVDFIENCDNKISKMIIENIINKEKRIEHE